VIFNWGGLPKLQGTVITGQTSYEILAKEFSSNPIIVLKKNQKNLKSLKLKAEEIKEGPLIAIGGGSIIDSVKVLSNNLDMKWISIPTALSHDGIASNKISLEDYTGNSRPPIAVFGVKSVLEKNELNKMGLGDIFSKYSSLADWKLSCEKQGEEWSRENHELILQSLKICEEGDKQLFKALCLLGMSINRFKNSRPTSGSEHMVAHLIKTGQHGFKVAIASLFILKVFERAGLDSFTLIHSKDLRKKMEEKKLPTTLDEIGISRKDFCSAVEKTSKLKDKWGILNEIPLKTDEINRIVESLGI